MLKTFNYKHSRDSLGTLLCLVQAGRKVLEGKVHSLSQFTALPPVHVAVMLVELALALTTHSPLKSAFLKSLQFLSPSTPTRCPVFIHLSLDSVSVVTVHTSKRSWTSA